MKIGVIREGKVPPDSRVPLTPEQCAFLNKTGDWYLNGQSPVFICLYTFTAMQSPAEI